MTRLLFVAEIRSEEKFEADMRVDERTPELTANLLLDTLARGKVVWGSVSKIPEHAGESVQ